MRLTAATNGSRPQRTRRRRLCLGRQSGLGRPVPARATSPRARMVGESFSAQDIRSRRSIMIKLTPGKLEGLKAVSDKRGVIAAAAMDQRGSLQKSLAKEAG